MLQKFKSIKIFVFDVDGVLTDGSLHLAENGDQLRIMNIRDGFALQYAIKKGYEVVVISGGQSKGVEDRLRKLGMKNIYLGINEKTDKMDELLRYNGWKKEQILYMGDDLPDLKVMKMCGLPCCPDDACEEIRALSEYISPFNGGKGCVRDVIEKVLKLNHHWVTN